MSGEFEALGDAVTGGLLGRAVEPSAGEIGPDGRTHETHCLNCGTELVGKFCHACGQHANVRRTLTSLAQDFVVGMLNFEGKIWRTLPLLAWKPGELTRRYIHGQRASFISPIALFLFSVFLMFAAAELTKTGFGQGPVPPVAKTDLANEIRADQAKLAKLQEQRAARLKAGRSTESVDEKITDMKAEITAITAIKDKKLPTGPVTFDTGDETPGWLREGVKTAAKNPELTFYKLKENASKFSWLIIPLSVPFVWLLFPFSRRYRLYDHTVFVTYSLCFMSLLVVAGILFQAGGLTALAAILWLIPPFHIYRQLKGAYELSRWGAIWRTTLLTVFAIVVVSIFAALVVGMEVFD